MLVILTSLVAGVVSVYNTCISADPFELPMFTSVTALLCVTANDRLLTIVCPVEGQ